jgi:hypothetical protein
MKVIGRIVAVLFVCLVLTNVLFGRAPSTIHPQLHWLERLERLERLEWLEWLEWVRWPVNALILWHAYRLWREPMLLVTFKVPSRLTWYRREHV